MHIYISIYIYIHTHISKIILSIKKKFKNLLALALKSCEICTAVSVRLVVHLSISHSLLLSLHLLWLPSIHNSPAIYAGQEEHPQLCCFSSVSVCYPSPLEQAETPLAILSSHIHFVSISPFIESIYT